MTTCEINRTTVSTGIKDRVKRHMDFSGLFNYEDEMYVPIDQQSNYQDVINRVNFMFSEEMVMQMGNEAIYGIVEPSDTLISRYVPSVPQDVPNKLNTQQDAEFKKLQDAGLISQDSNVVNGRVYYKVPNANEENVGRLQDLIAAKDINFLKIVDGPDVLVEVGFSEKMPETQASRTLSTKASPITRGRVLRFLENVGFKDVKSLATIVHNGKVLDTNAFIDFATGTMRIREGMEDYTLPEEAMHILVKLVQQSRPPLYAQMKKDIVNYKIYRDVVSDPGYNIPLYKNEDGTLNYDKLKDEAIAKLLAEYLISGIQGVSETQTRKMQVDGWWNHILQWIKDLFGLYKNPFQSALEEIDSDDVAFGDFTDISSDDVFLSAKSTSQIDTENPNNKDLWNIIKTTPEKLSIYKVDEEYYKNNAKISGTQRVSNLVETYRKKIFGNRNLDPNMTDFWDQSRRDGSAIHKVMEDIVKANIDATTGLLKRTAGEITFPAEGSSVTPVMVQQLEGYIRKFLTSFDEGTRFIAEQIIFDPNAVNTDKSVGRYGTVDFLAISPTGTVDIYDWKSVLLKDAEGVKDYKKEEINIQLNEYARILRSQYNVKKIGKIRAVPISKNYEKDKTTNIRSLKSLEIGDADPTLISSEKRFLRPIVSKEESTGFEDRDKVIKKLEALYQKYVDKGYFQSDRNILHDIQEAIYEIRVLGTIDNLGNYFVDLTTKLRQFLPEAEKLVEGKKEDITEALATISFYQDIVKNVVAPTFSITEDVNLSKESRNNLQVASGQLTYISQKMDGLRDKLLDSLAKKEGIFDLLLPEKLVNLFKRWFRSMGDQDVASIRYMYELTKKVYNRISLKTDDDLRTLKQLKYDFDQWRKTNSKDVKDATNMLVNTETAKIHSKINPEFYKAREEAFESKDKEAIKKFVQDNYDLTAYTQWYNKTLEENKKIWENSTYNQDPKINSDIIRKKIIEFQKNYNVVTNPITAFGYHNVRIWGRNIKEEKWYSKEYQELKKPGNESLLAMYNFMINKNEELAEVGGIKDFQKYTFFPNVRKTFADILSFEDSSTLAKLKDGTLNALHNAKASLTIEDYELNFLGARDPFTGDKLEKRFVPYVNRLSSEDQSFDLFKVYGLMSKEVNKEMYLRENDEILRSLVHMERMKPNLLQGKYEKLSLSPDGTAQASNKVGGNAPILEEHVLAYVNGESIQSDLNFAIRFKLREKWNKSWLGKLYQFDTTSQEYSPTTISVSKFILWLNNANQRRILGLNAASAISNLFGGTLSSLRLYKKYMSEADLRNAMFKMTSGGFYQTDDMKKRAAMVDLFLPLLNNRENFKSSQLSVSEASKILSQEWLMAPMRKTSEIVQLNIFLAIIENTGVIEGKLVNLREKASTELDYFNRYEKSPADRKALENDLEKKVKEYKEKYSIIKHATFKTVKEAGKDKVIVEIPGVSRDSQDVQVLRDIVQTMSKDALGETDEFDLANYKYSIWGRLFMTFKNWIPRQVDVRWGEFRYSQAHQSHEYGRFRMFAKALTANYIQTAAKIIPIPYVTGKITDAALSKEALIQRAKEVYLEKVADAKKLGKYNPDTFISQGEFVDRFVKGVDSTFEEMRIIISLSLLLFFGLAAPDDDDDSEEKAYKALIRRQIDKLTDEVGFFYNPKSGIDIAGGGVPMLSLIRDTWNLGSDVTSQFFGFTFEQVGWDEKGIKMQERAKPVRRLFKVLPVLKEILTYLPAVDEGTAKEWGVKVSDRRGF